MPGQGKTGGGPGEDALRIAFVYDLVHPYTIGGAERRIYELGRRLARRHDVHLVGLKHWSGPASLRTEEGLTLHGVPMPPFPLYGSDGRRHPLQPLWFGLSILRWPGLLRADVVDCSSFPFFSTFSARAHAALSRAPLIGTWHEFWGDYWSTYAPRLAPVGRAVERLAFAVASRVVCVSEHTRRRLAAAGLADRRVCVVPNGVDLAGPVPGAAPDGAVDLVFVGRLIEEKGAHLLLQALAREALRGATCAIVGTGPQEVPLRALAAALGLAERVRFVPRLPQPELNALVASARALVLPSAREGFGMVVLEAMALGTPVVVTTSAQSAAPDLVSDAEDGFVVERHAEALVRPLATLLQSPTLRARMGAAARRKALRHGWDEIAERQEAVYREAVGARRGTRHAAAMPGAGA